MGLLRRTESAARELSGELREDQSSNMRRRRAVIGLSSLGAASLGLIGLYQTGIIKHLPEPPLPYLNAEKVDASPEAYEWLSTPDAFLGIGSFGATMTLAAMGGTDRATKQPFIPIALAGKAALDVFNAARLTRDQWTKHRAFCIWCLIAAGATFATVPFVIPEAVEAVRNLRFGGSTLVRKAA